MRRKSFEGMECAIAWAIDQLGDPWTLLLLRTAFLGVRRFQDFVDRTGVTPTTLTRRLAMLQDLDLLRARRVDARPPRDEYELTEKGREVLPVLLALGAWGARWGFPRGAPLELADPRTGALLEAVVVDRHTGAPLRAGAVSLRPGPGASRALKAALKAPLLLGAERRVR